jgi:hypothetical protein
LVLHAELKTVAVFIYLRTQDALFSSEI